MNARKIDAMHILYGLGEGTCADCPHFEEGYYHDKKLMKCSVYGMTHSEATDWRKKYPACGLKTRPFPEYDRRVIEILRRGRIRMDVPVEGQITMDEVIGK